MKLRSKIAVSAALLGAFSTVHAEAITFGVEVPPVASITVSQGLLVTAKALTMTTASVTDPALAPFVGAFTVNTNMPKWNVYFTLANNGYLVDQSGNYLMDNVTPAPNYLGLGKVASAVNTAAGQIWLKFPANPDIKGTDGGATHIIQATSANLNTATSGVVSNATNTLTKVLAATPAACAVACVDNGWVYATAPTLATFGIGTMIDPVANKVNAIAGTYTETLYLTLVTAY